MPADEEGWRVFLLEFPVADPVRYPTVLDALLAAGEHARGMRSTVRALLNRGLVGSVEGVVRLPENGWTPRLRVQLTELGRQVAGQAAAGG
ncbi:hypothetical protein [Kitasatospora camelliae]|uniref:Uncharacterized protein n=1 Tax=Kitasatospora camelliae TaxID=3156397 RepID=A0AAU8JP85_9ACTN